MKPFQRLPLAFAVAALAATPALAQQLEGTLKKICEAFVATGTY